MIQLKNVIKQVCRLQYSDKLRRIYTSCKNNGTTYDCPGKTTVTMLHHSVNDVLLVGGIDQTGFTLNNGVKVIGPMVLFASTILSWNIASSKDMNESNLQIFSIIEPKLDLVVVGLDDQYEFSFITRIRDIFKKLDIGVEVLPIYHACATFNFVSAEGRYTAGVFIPPKKQLIPLSVIPSNHIAPF